MKSSHIQTLLQDEKIKDAEKNQGESELRDALLAKAEYLTKIGEKDEAVESIR
jgi:26S proteasome regulatory subunit N7